jgi:hypothetical protein
MLILALAFFVFAGLLTGLDVTGRIHGGGGVVTLLLMLSWIALAAKTLSVIHRDHLHHHR